MSGVERVETSFSSSGNETIVFVVNADPESGYGAEGQARTSEEVLINESYELGIWSFQP